MLLTEIMQAIKLIKSKAKAKLNIDFVFFIIALILSYYFMELRFNFNPEYPRATMSMLMNGTAAKPFQFRVLIPWMINTIINIRLPIPILNNYLFLFKLVEVISVFFLVVSFRYYLSFFFRDKRINSLLSFTLFYVLFFNLILPVLNGFLYPSDIPSILFFTLGLILLYKKKWIIYYPLFVIATFNRETTIFLTSIYFFAYVGKDKLKSISFHCLCQVVIWFAIKYFLYQLFIDNPGLAIGLHNVDYNVPKFYINLFLLRHFITLRSLSRIMGYIWVPIPFYFWVITDDFVKRSLLVCLLFFIVVFFFANSLELRDYNELIPIILVAFLLIMREFIRKAGFKFSSRY